MTPKQQAWKLAYGRQRVYRGKAIYVAPDQDITEALRQVMPVRTRVIRTRMNSGSAASFLDIYPPE